MSYDKVNTVEGQEKSSTPKTPKKLDYVKPIITPLGSVEALTFSTSGTEGGNRTITVQW